MLQQITDYANYPEAIAIGLVLLVLILILMAALTVLQQRDGRSRPAVPDRGGLVTLLWDELKAAVPLIFHGNPYLFSVIGFTLQVAAIATVIAAVVGVPIGLALGLGRFRGRRWLQILANASLGLPPVLVGLFLFLLFVPQAPLGGLAAEHDPAGRVHRPGDPGDARTRSR